MESKLHTKVCLTIPPKIVEVSNTVLQFMCITSCKNSKTSKYFFQSS